MSDSPWRNSLLWLVVAVLLLTVWMTFGPVPGARADVVPISQVIADVEQGRVHQIQGWVGSPDIIVTYEPEAGGDQRRSTAATPIDQLLVSLNVDPSRRPEIIIHGESRWGSWLGGLSLFLPTLFLVGIFLFMMRKARRPF